MRGWRAAFIASAFWARRTATSASDAAKGKPDVSGCNDGSSRGVYTVIFGWRKG